LAKTKLVFQRRRRRRRRRRRGWWRLEAKHR
jgi:hypothetical protein